MGEIGLQYAPRPAVFYGVEELGGWQVKVYGISATATKPRNELLAAARARAWEVLSGTSEKRDLSAAFLVAHDARPACFALVHWWDGVDLFQRYFRAPLDQPNKLEPLENGQVGCVWELAIIAFECQAWSRHVLRPGEPDIAAYLGDRLRG
jgi:hypothetical protein